MLHQQILGFLNPGALMSQVIVLANITRELDLLLFIFPSLTLLAAFLSLTPDPSYPCPYFYPWVVGYPWGSSFSQHVLQIFG
jgi:hypothetical protein